MNIPTRKQCFQIIHDMEMMDHIIDHSVMVGNVALCLGRALKENCPDLNIELTAAAALLHDITKTRSFATGELHSKTGGTLIKEMGYPEVGDIIRQHVILDHSGPDTPVSEEEIVNYADKRVLHDQVVSLDRRLEYIRVRYGTKQKFRDRIAQMWEMTTGLEDKLFRQLPFRPSQLRERILEEIKK